VTVVGKVFRPNPRKVLALNRTLGEYFMLVKWYLGFNSDSKTFLHENGYESAMQLYNKHGTNSDRRDKAVDILKSFEENKIERHLEA